jgi:branched-chain amino acid transport system substrate-binding protein
MRANAAITRAPSDKRKDEVLTAFNEGAARRVIGVHARSPESRGKRARLIATALTGIATVVAAGCSSSPTPSAARTGSGSSAAASTGDITIATTTELSGALSSAFSPVALGLKAAVDQINANGGIRGHMLKLAAPYDSESTPAGGTTAAQQAVSADPAFIISGGGSAEVSSGAPVYTQAGIPWADLSGGIPGIQPYHFSLNATSNQLGAAMLTEAARSSSATPLTIGIIGLDSPAVDGEINAIKADAKEKNVKIADTEVTTTTLTSFASQAERLVAAHPDVILDLDTLTSTILEVRALTTTGYKGEILGATAAGSVTALQRIALSNYAGERQTQLAAPGSVLYKIAQSVGAADLAVDSNYFSSGFATLYAMASVLKACGVPCSNTAFQKTAQTMGNISIPDSATFGPVRFSSQSHYGETSLQFFKWDSASNTAVPDGGVIPLS